MRSHVFLDPGSCILPPAGAKAVHGLTIMRELGVCSFSFRSFPAEFLLFYARAHGVIISGLIYGC